MDEFRLSAANELSSASSEAIQKAHGKLEKPAEDPTKYTVHLGKAKGVTVGC